MVNAEGKVTWHRDLARVKGQPFATKTQAMIPTADGVVILKRSDGTIDGSVEGITPGQCYGVAVYHDKLCLIRSALATTNYDVPPPHVRPL